MTPTRFLERMECGMVITEIVGPERFRVIWTNPEFAKIAGYPIQHIVGRDPWMLHSGIAPEAESEMRRKVRERGTCRGIIQLACGDGVTRWVEVTAHPAREDGRCTLVGLINDWSPEIQDRFRTLSQHQERVFALMANGIDVKESMSILNTTERFVRYNHGEILRKLRIESLAQLFLY